MLTVILFTISCFGYIFLNFKKPNKCISKCTSNANLKYFNVLWSCFSHQERKWSFCNWGRFFKQWCDFHHASPSPRKICVDNVALQMLYPVFLNRQGSSKDQTTKPVQFLKPSKQGALAWINNFMNCSEFIK